MNDGATLARARHWLQVRRPERCLEVLAGIEGSIDSRDFFRFRAMALIQLARWPEAADSARRGLAIAPDDPGLAFLLGHAVEKVGRGGAEEAERIFLRGLSVTPRSIALLTGYAALLVRMRQLDRAEKLLDDAARISPDAILVDLVRMRWALARGKRSEAVMWVNRALDKDPTSPEALAFAGSLDRMGGRAAAGARRLRMAATQRLGDRDLTTYTRQTMMETHPLMWPVRVLRRTSQRARFMPSLITAALLLLWVGLSDVDEEPLGLAMVLAWTAFLLYCVIAVKTTNLILRRRR